jgi:membrane protease YdiL (CAAX protease family)
MLLVLAPLLEETVFRAGLQEALLRHWRRRPCLANAMSAAAFGLAHAAVRADAAALAAALPALLIGAVYQRTGRLRYCIVLHAAMNAAWLGWSMTGASLLGYR